MIEGEVEAVALILAKTKALNKAFLSFIQAISVEFPKVGLAIGKGRDARSCHPLNEFRGLCPLLCYRFPRVTRQLSMTIT